MQRGPPRAADAKAFVWIGLHEPTEEEFDAIQAEFDLHELAVEDAIKAHQRPKLEVYGDTVFVVLKTARYVDPEEVVRSARSCSSSATASSSPCATARRARSTGCASAWRSNDELLSCGPGAVLHAIIDRVVDDYAPVIAGLEEDIEEVEEEVFSAARDERGRAHLQAQARGARVPPRHRRRSWSRSSGWPPAATS